MNNFKLKDLTTVERHDGTYYFFPNSPVKHTKEEAEKLLIISNYQGELLDVVNIDLVVKIISEIEGLKENILGEIDSMQDYLRDKLSQKNEQK